MLSDGGARDGWTDTKLYTSIDLYMLYIIFIYTRVAAVMMKKWPAHSY